MSILFNVIKKILTTISSFILFLLSLIIILSIFSRFLGISLHWYDEVSAILLAWLTFYGSALCAINRSHMGFGNIVSSLPLHLKKFIFILNEIIVILFFILLSWAGLYVLSIFGDETLSSLEFIPMTLSQSALPIGCILFIIAEIFSIPKAYKTLLLGKTQDNEEIEQILEEVNNNKDIKLAKEKIK